MVKEIPQRLVVCWIILAFVIWCFTFLGFLSSRLMLVTPDSASYYNHIRFFIENLSHGVYPLWDPYWENGVSNDFFLRRIGAFNPLYLIILVFKSVGIPFTLSYLWFLALYYWSGMIAFYLLAMRLYQDRFIAYGGYLMLLFSGLGTRLFDSYLMLVTVPIIWFFYFLVAFSQTPRKHFFLGTVLSLMILLGTYIPLYFLIILGLFLTVFVLIYFDQLPAIFKAYIEFIKKNKMTVVSSLLVLFLSIVPILIFFHDSARGQLVLPSRHGNAGSGHTLIVPRQYSNWGAVEALMYSSFFSDLRQYKFEVVYVPFFSIIILILGLIGRINRRAAFIFILGAALFCIIVPHGFPFYDFLYDHTSILKYFRNLHFFLWFFLIPLFVLLVLEHWRMFLEIKVTKLFQQRLLFFFVVLVHLSALIFIWYRKDPLVSSYIMILLSFILCSLMLRGKLKNSTVGLALLTAVVLIQPLEIYHYFSLKADPYIRAYIYEFSYSTIKLKDVDLVNTDITSNSKDALYYVSGAYNYIYQNVSNLALATYLQNKFMMVDRLELSDPHQINTSDLEHNFLMTINKAIVFNKLGQDMKLMGNDPAPSLQARRIDEGSKDFKVLSFNANDVRIALDERFEKFLIYNDSYDDNWHVSINHQKAEFYEVNGAFKGTWVPAGKSIVEFTYGAWWQYAMNILLSIFAVCLLLGIIWFACISDRSKIINGCKI